MSPRRNLLVLKAVKYNQKIKIRGKTRCKRKFSWERKYVKSQYEKLLARRKESGGIKGVRKINFS